MANFTKFLGNITLSRITLVAFYPRYYSQSRITAFRVNKCLYHMEISSNTKNTNNTSLLLKYNQRQLFSTNYTSTVGKKSNEEIVPVDDFRENIEKTEKYSKGEKENFLLRIKILDASLQFVNVYGWSQKTIVVGAESLGYLGITHGIFQDGGIELIRHFYNKCNEKLIENLKNETKNGEIVISEPIEFLMKAVKTRLEMIEPYLSHWPQALTIMSSPQNASTSLAQLLTLVDDICYYSGDKSVDFGWYTRRIGLAAIYKMTELYMLQDSSTNHEETWNFLRKRMEEASSFESIISGSEGLTQNVQQKLVSAFATARNILGLDYNRT